MVPLLGGQASKPLSGALSPSVGGHYIFHLSIMSSFVFREIPRGDQKVLILFL